MKTPLERSMELEDLVREAFRARYPAQDPEWALNRNAEQLLENSRKQAQILIRMMPEVIRATRKTTESKNATAKTD